MVKKALLVGINYVNQSYALQGCHNDAECMSNELVNNWFYDEKQIVLLRDDDPRFLPPTKAELQNQINRLLQGVQKGDQLFFLYSGHGSEEKDTSGDEDDGLDEDICPLDFKYAGMISDDWLHENLVKKVPEGVQLFCIFDSCHSGTILDIKYTLKVAAQQPRNENHYEFRMLYKENIEPTNGNVVCISGCRDNQTSADAFSGGRFGGALTSAVLEVLAMTGRDIEYGSFLTKVQQIITQRGYSQEPILCFGRQTSPHDRLNI